MRALPLSLALLAAACTAEFPPLDGDGGPPLDQALITDGAVLARDLTPPPVDRGGRPPGDAEDRDPEDRDPQTLDAGPTDDATLLRDAAVRDQSPPPDMPPPAPRVMLDASEAPPSGCAPRTVTLTWRTLGVDRCTLRAGPDVLRELQGPDAAFGEHAVPGVVADTRFELTCEGPQAAADASFVAIFDPALPPTLDLLRGGGGIDQTQRTCAAALGEAQMANDGAVDNHAGSAARLCQCQGYGGFDIVSAKRGNCFASPHDNSIWSWNGSQWSGQRALGHNHCLEHIRCSAPVATCGALLYPR